MSKLLDAEALAVLLHAPKDISSIPHTYAIFLHRQTGHIPKFYPVFDGQLRLARAPNGF